MEKRYGLAGPLAAVALAGALGGLTIGAIGLHSLPPTYGHGPIHSQVAQLTDELQLTTAQREEIVPVLLQRHEKVEALFDQYPTRSRKALAPDLKAIRRQANQQIEAFLTPRQKALLAVEIRIEDAHFDDRIDG
jgi:C4-dicarboxylate-specific signal transduction histidine kinase